MPAHDIPDIAQLKRDAARLLKAVRSGDADATRRLARLDNPPADPQLKHALTVVAQEAGFESWTTLKQSHGGLDFSEFFAGPGFRDSLNPWFNNYDEARACLDANGGVLLPYRQHFFVSSLAILGRLGYEADHPDWKDIGHDFVRPASDEAHSRIKATLDRRFGTPNT